MVGGRNAEVAYSTDGGGSFIRIAETVGTSDIQVEADANYQENSIIYAATDAPDNGIWRWTVGDDVLRVEPSDRADLRCGIGPLSSVLPGFTDLSGMIAVGRVEAFHSRVR